MQVLEGLGASPTRSLRDRKTLSRQSLVSNIEGCRGLKREKLGVHSFERVVRPACLLLLDQHVCHFRLELKADSFSNVHVLSLSDVVCVVHLSF